MTTTGDDIITGTSKAESLGGGDGNDTIYARSGHDFIDGGRGDDVLYGESGNDTFWQYQGSDLIYGGSGTDMVDYYQLNGPVTVDLENGLATKAEGGTDRLDSIEDIGGSLYDDVLIGDDRANFINGAYGEDTITLGRGRDTYHLSDLSERGDTITDFHSGEDTLSFHRSEVFRLPETRPPAGVLGEQYFIEGSAAQTPEQILIFNPDDHTIYYDPDGSGTRFEPGALIHLSAGATVEASDFFLV